MEELNLLTKSDLHKRLSDQVKQTNYELDTVREKVNEIEKKMGKTKKNTDLRFKSTTS